MDVGMSNCAFCRLCVHMASLKPGERLFRWSPSQFLAKLRKYLALARVPFADKYTLKCYRAGRATELALQGKPIGQILMAGEWRSSAFTKYVDNDALDQSNMLISALEESDEEVP